MLAATNCLRDSKVIARVKQIGKQYQSENYTLLVLPRKDNNPLRFAIIASTQVHKNASIRNKVKRGIREAIRQSIYSMKPGYDCVIIAKPSSVSQYTTDAMQEILALVGKSSVVRGRLSQKK